MEGHDICLHGFYHRANGTCRGLVARLLGQVYTDREGEFFQIGAPEAEERLRRGLALFRNTELPVHGFTPPAWLLSQEGRTVLQQTGLRYATSLNHIELLQESRHIYAPALVLSCRSSWRRLLSRIWVHLWFACNRNQSVLRLAVHPIDLTFPEIEDTVFSLLRVALRNRTPCTYRDLLQTECAVRP
jgi:hypothetical protein